MTFFMEKNKDNPVPSLDNLKKEFYNREDLWTYDSGTTVENVFKFLKEKLQNGVETNKEQPKKLPTHFKIIKGPWINYSFINVYKWYKISELQLYNNQVSCKSFAWINIKDCIFK